MAFFFCFFTCFPAVYRPFELGLHHQDCNENIFFFAITSCFSCLLASYFFLATDYKGHFPTEQGECFFLFHLKTKSSIIQVSKKLPFLMFPAETIFQYRSIRSKHYLASHNIKSDCSIQFFSYFNL